MTKNKYKEEFKTKLKITFYFYLNKNINNFIYNFDINTIIVFNVGKYSFEIKENRKEFSLDDFLMLKRKPTKNQMKVIKLSVKILMNFSKNSQISINFMNIKMSMFLPIMKT